MARSEAVDDLIWNSTKTALWKAAVQISVTVTDSMAITSCGRDSYSVTVRDPSLGHCPMGLGRSLDLRWMEKVAGGGIEVDD